MKVDRYNGRLLVETGITGSTQEGSFMNATLQGVSLKDAEGNYLQPVLDMSIACNVDVPAEYAREEEKLVQYLSALFGDIVLSHPAVSISIQLGPYGDGPDA